MIKFPASWRRLFKERLFCGLDIGSQKMKASLFRVQDADNLELLAVAETDTKGLDRATVNDISELSSAVGTVLSALVKRSKSRFRDVELGLSSNFIQTRMSRAVISLVQNGSKLIAARDVKRVRYQARLLGVKLDEEVITDVVRHFKVDDIGIANNPVGLFGRKLEVETLLAVLNITHLRNLTKAIRQAGFDTGRVYFNPEVLAAAVLDQKQRMEGCILVDIGAQKTEIMIFKGGLLKYFNFAFFGGERLTKKLSVALKLSLDVAEDIKKKYGQAPDADYQKKEDVLINGDEGCMSLDQQVLATVIQEDLDELTQHIRDAIVASGLQDHLKSGIVMTGGGVLLPGLLEHIERSLNMPVELARNIPGLNQASLYVIGTSLSEAAYKGTLRYVFDKHKPKDWCDAACSKVSDFCSEYF